MTSWRLAAVLLVLTAGLFAIGVAVERGGGHDETAEHTEAVRDEPSETAERAEGHVEQAETGGEEHDDERVLGVDAESPLTVTAAVILSLGLAVVLWLARQRWLAFVVAVFALVFAAVDIGELAHQLDEGRTGRVVLAAIVTAGHHAAGVLASRPSPPPTP
jgi:hypothetical protein